MIFINMIQLDKIIKSVLTEQTLGQAVREANIAKKIYDAKGLFIDNEKDAVNAIKQIKTATEFNAVQRELQKLTGGRGIGQFVTGFIGAIEDKVDPAGIESGRRTLPLINSIISHLKKIKADSKSLKYFTDYANTLNVSSMGKIWNLDETMHNVNTAAQLTSLMIPIVGPFVSAGIGLLDAKAYYDEGDKYAAGLVAVLTLLPAGGVFLKLGKGPIKAFAKKIASKSTVWSNAEQEVLAAISKNKNIVKSKLAAITAKGLQAKKLAPAVLKTPAVKKTLDFILKGGTAGSKLGAEFVKYELPMLAYDVAYNTQLPTSTEMDAIEKETQLYAMKYLDQQLNKKPGIGESVIDAIVTAGAVSSASKLIGFGIATSAAVLSAWKLLPRAFPRLRRWTQWRRVSRDTAEMQKRGFTKEQIKAIWTKGFQLKLAKETIDDIIRRLRSGKVTPEDGLRELEGLVPPGQVTKYYDKFLENYAAKIPKKVKPTLSWDDWKARQPRVRQNAVDYARYLHDNGIVSNDIMKFPQFQNLVPTATKTDYQKYLKWAGIAGIGALAYAMKKSGERGARKAQAGTQPINPEMNPLSPDFAKSIINKAKKPDVNAGFE